MSSMSLDQALRTIQARSAFLCYDERGIDLWTPQTKLPISARRSIVKHREQLHRLMRDGDIRVCASRNLHRRYWRYAGDGRYVCEVCQKIDTFEGMIAS